MADFGTFIFSVFNQWMQLLSGCIALVLIGLYEKFIRKGEVPIKIYTLVLAAFVFWACFEAWKEQYEINKNSSVIQKSLTDLQSKDEGLRTTIDELRQQLHRGDIEIQELKRLGDRAEDAASHAASENAALRSNLEDKNRTMRELQGKLADKVARHTHRDKIAQFLHDGMAMQQRCFNGLTEYPKKDFLDWQEQVLAYVKATMSSSHVIRFTDTMINIRLHFFDKNRQTVSGICADTGREVEAKLVVLREFLSEFTN